MAAKSIIAGEYILQIADNGHVDVVRVFRNAKKTMTDIAAAKNFPVEEKWNTQDLGRHLVKEFGDGKTAQFDDITINKMADGKIEIYQECKNTKEALRTISEQLGFEYDKDWTTQQFGAKLEKFLEEHKDIADKVLKTPNAKKNATTADMEGMEGYRREEKEDSQTSSAKNSAEEKVTGEMKNLHIRVGGERGKWVRFVHSANDDFFDRLEELRDNDDSCEIEEYINELVDDGDDFDPMWCIQPYTDGDTNVIVENEDGDVLYEDSMSYDENLGDPRNWKCDENMDSAKAAYIQSVVNDAISNYSEDEMEDMASEAAHNIAWADVANKIKQCYAENCWAESEEVPVLAMVSDTYGFEYCFDVLIPANEEFDPAKMSLFCCDYEDAAPDFCEDAVAPILKYGNILYEGFCDDVDNHYDQFGLATINGVKDYVEISFECGDF